MNKFGVSVLSKDQKILAQFLFDVWNDWGKITDVLKGSREYRELYHNLSQQNGFKEAVSKITNIPIENLPMLEKCGEVYHQKF